jgi:hypothetical protein
MSLDESLLRGGVGGFRNSYPSGSTFRHPSFTTERIASECAVTRAEPVFGFCGALILAVLQLGVRWRWAGPLLGQWPDFGG